MPLQTVVLSLEIAIIEIQWCVKVCETFRFTSTLRPKTRHYYTSENKQMRQIILTIFIHLLEEDGENLLSLRGKH